MQNEFFIGVDLGQKQDFTAIAVVERRAPGPPNFLNPWTIPSTTFDLRHLERVPLGTPYPQVVERIARISRLPELAGRSTLVVDATGVGAPVIDLLREANLECSLVAITITGGEHAHHSHGGHHVPRRDLIATLEVLLEDCELRFAALLTERRRLVEELMSLRATGHNPMHDDLVMALALACWQARKLPVGHQGNRLL